VAVAFDVNRFGKTEKISSRISPSAHEHYYGVNQFGEFVGVGINTPIYVRTWVRTWVHVNVHPTFFFFVIVFHLCQAK
jgi:hypothetical protein